MSANLWLVFLVQRLSERDVVLTWYYQKLSTWRLSRRLYIGARFGNNAIAISIIFQHPRFLGSLLCLELNLLIDLSTSLPAILGFNMKSEIIRQPLVIKWHQAEGRETKASVGRMT